MKTTVTFDDEEMILVPRKLSARMMAATADAFSGVDACINIAFIHGCGLQFKDGLPPLVHAWNAILKVVEEENANTVKAGS